MAASLANMGAMGGMHTAGIYSDMTVDGPEIGTLVVIVDRAKNLPNRKTMGKQNPYCAARLGKEAKKTETDRRGGQTPKWDQELRFTVHESPDYNNLKVSVFNDDKKTDMIGEMWVNLEQVIVAGGGKMDTWHTLNYKGKYAGEVMLELTYYDSRPDEREGKLKETQRGHDRKIRRKPLLADLHTTPLPHQMENTRTAGPRAMGSRPRASSSIPSQPAAPPVQYPHHHPDALSLQQGHRQPSHEELDFHPGFQPHHHASLPDLPEVLPLRAHRGSLPPQPRNMTPQVPHAHSHHARTQSHPDLPHSHSAPSAVPQAHDPHAYPTARAPRQRRYDEPPGWDGQHMAEEASHRAAMQPTVEDEDDTGDLPPLPPSHRSSMPRAPSLRSHSIDDYAAPPRGSEGYGAPDFAKSYSGPSQYAAYSPSSAASSPSHARPSSAHRLPHHHSMPDAYAAVTPPRAHPLAQEMRRGQSPAPHYQPHDDAYGQGHPPESALGINPRAISPAPTAYNRPSIASIRHPVQSFASQNSPSDLPTRKSVSPRPSTASSVPFSPDDYGSFNPNASASSPYTHAQTTNPHSPYHIPNTPRGASEEPEAGARPLPDPDGPITTWDGRTVDPSDHLPVHSWAPEPIKKSPKPEKTYGAGAIYDPSRPRGMTGPRQNVHNVPSSGGRVGRDVVVNIRTKHSNPGSPSLHDPSSPNPQSAGRNRAIMRGGGLPHPSSPHVGAAYALQEIEVPDPYASGHQYSDGFADGRPGVQEGMQTRYRSRSPAPHYQQQQLPPPEHHQQQQQQQRHYGDMFGGNYDDPYAGNQYAPDEYGGGYAGQPPHLPPKVPFDDHAYGASALEKELQRIDIGGSRRPGSRSGGGTVRGRFGG